VCTAFSNAFYWVPINYVFTKNVENNIGKNLSFFKIASIISKIIGPLIAVYVFTNYGINELVGFAILFYVLSFLFLFFKKNNKSDPEQDKRSLDVSNDVETLERKNFKKKFAFSYALTGVCDTASMFWLVYIYINTLEMIDVGYIASVIQIGYCISNYLIGYLIDKKKGDKLAIIGLLTYCCIWIMRPFMITPLPLYLLSVLMGFVAPFFNIYIFAEYLKASKKFNKLEYDLSKRDIMIKTGGTALLITFIFFGMMIPFILTGLSSANLFLSIKKTVKNRKE